MSVISTKPSVVSAPNLVSAAVATTTTATTSLLSGHHPVLGRGQSPRGPSPNRDRDNYR